LTTNFANILFIPNIERNLYCIRPTKYRFVLVESRIIPFTHVAADHAANAVAQDSSHSSSKSRRFNTCDHTRDEILPIVPERPAFTHEKPPWTPYSYTLFLPLIAKSQRMTGNHICNIPSFLYDDLMGLFSRWMTSGKIDNSALEEVIEAWMSTKSGKHLPAILDGEAKWFLRLDQMSPKDSQLGGADPASTLTDVIRKICSSMRAHGCLQSAKHDADRDDTAVVMQLILNPWDPTMDPAKEFRVFVPPPVSRV